MTYERVEKIFKTHLKQLNGRIPKNLNKLIQHFVTKPAGATPSVRLDTTSFHPGKPSDIFEKAALASMLRHSVYVGKLFQP